MTPVVAVLRELKKSKSADVRFWCDRKFAPQARSIIGHFDSSIPVQTVVAGKFRRYHNLAWWRQLLRPISIVLPNIRDAILVVCGFVQSLVRLIVWRPDVVFTKGGYVCLPVGLAARVLGIPLVIHDSDALPGLTNKVLGRFASAIATGAPLEHYDYPKAISRYVGVPIDGQFKPLTKAARIHAKESLGFDGARPLIVITGGGLGAKRINDAVLRILEPLLERGSVLLLSGSAQYDELRALTPESDPRFQLEAFRSHGMAEVLGAADVVIARAGATTLLELAAVGAPTILIPNGFLTGGHQLKNAAVYGEKNAVLIVDDNAIVHQPELLLGAVDRILDDPKTTAVMQQVFRQFAKPDAAGDMAAMIRQAAKRRRS